VVRLGEVAKIGNGSTPKRTNPAYWKSGTIPWLTSRKVHERVIRQADEFVTDLAREECHLPLVQKGSIVVAITGQGKTLGNAALVTFDTCVSQHLAYVQFRVPHAIPQFALAFLQQRYEDLRQASRAGGSTKGALTCGFLKSYPLPLPSVEEQREIVRIISAVDRRVEAEEQRKAALQELFKSMLHQLMTGQVRAPDTVEVPQ
jgi:type I restriction enzyme S subunit